MAKATKMVPDKPLGPEDELVFGLRIVRNPHFPDRFVGFPFGAYGGILLAESVEKMLQNAAECYASLLSPPDQETSR